jgi:pimeloyl-ACP methyl ester carboxylesterase
MKSKFIHYKNKNIHYREFGKGKPVILVHGFGEDGNIWNELIKNLKNDFYLIVPEIPGSGKSEMLDGENIFIEDYADVIKAILKEEKIALCCMIGHSMGGYITLAFAEKYSDMLNSFGLFHSSAFADDEEKKQTRRKAIEFIKENGAYAFLKTSIPNLFADSKDQNDIEKLIEKGKKFTPETLIQYYNAMINRPDRTELLKNFNQPILFIIGEKDNAIPLQAPLQQCHLPAISHVHILAVGHMGMIEEQKKSSGILLSFLQNI